MDQLEAGLRTSLAPSSDGVRVTAAGPVPDSHRLPDSPPLRGAHHLHCGSVGTSSCWSGSGYPCREPRDEAIDIRAVVETHDDEVWVCRRDLRDELTE